VARDSFRHQAGIAPEFGGTAGIAWSRSDGFSSSSNLKAEVPFSGPTVSAQSRVQPGRRNDELQPTAPASASVKLEIPLLDLSSPTFEIYEHKFPLAAGKLPIAPIYRMPCKA
jgi:hypothetical protein